MLPPLLLAVLVATPALAARGYRSEPLDEAAPETVAAEIRDLLATRAVRIIDSTGEPFLDVWLRKQLELVEPKSGVGIYFSALGEGNLIGVVRVHQKTEDFKGQRFRPGIYTCRYALQPQDGEHLGVSDSRDYLLLSKAADDRSAERRTVDELIELSQKASGRKHPSVFYLARFDEGDDLPRVVHDEFAERWLLECEISSQTAKGAAGKAVAATRLWIVFEGVAPGA